MGTIHSGTNAPQSLLTLALLLISLAPARAAADAPQDVSDRRQLFIDDRFIAASEGVKLTMNPPQKLGLILNDKGQPSFEGHISRVIEDQGKICLYIGADALNVLESDDGLHFRKLDVTIAQGGALPTMFLDRHDPDPARRYKIFGIQARNPFDPKTDGVFAAYSGDGIHFTPVGRVLPMFTDNPLIVDWDARINKYVIFARALAYDSRNQRRITRIETDDPLKPWPVTPNPNKKPERVYMSTEDVPVVLAADKEDDPDSDIYYNSATIYPWAQDVYLMFTAQFRHLSPHQVPELQKNGRKVSDKEWEDFGFLEVQLAASRDGIHWNRPSREPYVPEGLSDEWDRWYAVMGPGMARRGNYLYQYYYSTGHTHDSGILRQEYEKSAPRMGGIGVARQRLDGFVSADADYKGGWLETPPLTFKGNQLHLNIDTGAMGTAFAELRDAGGKPISGFRLTDCEEVGGNYVDYRVQWKGNADVSSLAGKPVRLYFKLTRAKLYAFQFAQR